MLWVACYLLIHYKDKTPAYMVVTSPAGIRLDLHPYYEVHCLCARDTRELVMVTDAVYTSHVVWQVSY